MKEIVKDLKSLTIHNKLPSIDLNIGDKNNDENDETHKLELKKLRNHLDMVS